MFIRFIALLFIIVTQFSVVPATYANENKIMTLRVALYPYVPGRLALFHKVETIFESRNPGVNLELVEDKSLLWDYYSGGLEATQADVYEVDTVLLSDLIHSGKISPLELPSTSYSKEAIEAVTRDGKTWGLPHWLCGNFLFYIKGDKEIEKAATWKELNTILASRNESIFVDFKGKSTLGEWYLTVLSGLYGLEKAQDMVLKQKSLDSTAVNKLKAMLEECPTGSCRNDDLHDRIGYYARAFMSGKSSAYVGYSESIHFGIQYAMDNCTETTGCVSVDNIAIRRLPGFDGFSGNEGIGWVDALALDAQLTPEKKELAKKFIVFMSSDEAYNAILKTDWGKAPTYLLPAKKGLQIENAPLYPSFYKNHSGRRTGTRDGLNEKLKEIGLKLDCALPINETDTTTLKRCSQ